jgi:hypothetical protein
LQRTNGEDLSVEQILPYLEGDAIARINELDQNGKTPLERAATKHNTSTDIVLALLDKGALYKANEPQISEQQISQVFFANTFSSRPELCIPSMHAFLRSERTRDLTISFLKNGIQGQFEDTSTRIGIQILTEDTDRLQTLYTNLRSLISPLEGLRDPGTIIAGYVVGHFCPKENRALQEELTRRRLQTKSA